VTDVQGSLRILIGQSRLVVAVLVISAFAIWMCGTLVAGCESESAAVSGVEDSYFGKSGNGGYDVLEYRLALTIDPTSGSLAGECGIDAQATQTLESLHLDYAGPDIASVEVDNVPADFKHRGGELIIFPATPHSEGQIFEVLVSYSGVPKPLETCYGPHGWLREGDTIYTLGEPQGALAWYPVNDHPSDKATYRFELTVPDPYVAVASGMLVETRSDEVDRTYVWEMDRPLASYVAAVSVGRYELEETQVRDGLTIRNYFPPDLDAEARSVFASTEEILRFYEATFGPYPFDAYGVVVPNATCYVGMENQTLSLFGREAVRLMVENDDGRDIMVPHELAHQWFGNSVTLSSWQDIWLNEGFSTYASWLWLEHKYGEEALLAEIQENRDWLNGQDQVLCGDPGADHLFSSTVYYRGALTLHALRLKLGDDVFFDILRQWNERYKLSNACTEDFIALAEEMGGVELSPFFNEWLCEDGELPELQ